MKMSDYFPLPLALPEGPAGETLVFDIEGDEIRAAINAVNHHDALVEALEDMLKVTSSAGTTMAQRNQWAANACEVLNKARANDK